MIKRLVWMGFGAVMGVTGWSYTNRRVKAAVDRYAPAEVRDRLAERARGVANGVKVAVDEGRTAMAAKEAELRRR